MNGLMNAITAFGVVAVTLMMVTYALERRHRAFTLVFAFACLLSSAYGFLAGAWPFGVVEVIWCGVAVRKFQLRSGHPSAARQLRTAKDATTRSELAASTTRPPVPQCFACGDLVMPPRSVRREPIQKNAADRSEV